MKTPPGPILEQQLNITTNNTNSKTEPGLPHTDSDLSLNTPTLVKKLTSFMKMEEHTLELIVHPVAVAISQRQTKPCPL